MLTKIKNFIKKHEVLYGLVFFLRNFKEEICSFLPWVPESNFKYQGQKPLHGDSTRQELTKSILNTLPVTSIVETGTYKGTTAEFFARNFSGPIFTCEVVGLYFRESLRRLRKYPNLKLIKKSSPDMLGFLREQNSYGKLPFFYLDAHWYDYWPILDEMRIIKSLPGAIVMIDDFEVPGRPELGYDVQEVSGKTIKNNLEFISKYLDSRNDRVFFPTYRKEIPRGYVMIFHNVGNQLPRLENLDFFAANYQEHKF